MMDGGPKHKHGVSATNNDEGITIRIVRRQMMNTLTIMILFRLYLLLSDLHQSRGT
jgi:hypothetical protein